MTPTSGDGSGFGSSGLGWSTSSDSASSGSSSVGGSSSAGEESGSTGLADDSSSSGTSTSDPPNTCGDGLIQAGEDCDDLNADDKDLCSNDCHSRRRAFLSAPLIGFTIGDPDSRCQSEADAARLGGTFRAWTSTTTGGAGLGPGPRFTHDTGWFVLVGIDAPRVARGFEDLIDGKLEHAITRDAFGAWVDEKQQPLVWTNVGITGLAGDADCGGWNSDTTGNVGNFYSAGGTWTAFTTIACDAKARLYCFEQREAG